MRLRNLLAVIILQFSSFVSFSQNADGCRDHPMFTSRMPHYDLFECRTNVDAHRFPVEAGNARDVYKEGTKTMIQYNTNSATEKGSTMQILRHFETAAKKAGGVTVFLSQAEAVAVFKIMRDDKEIAWAEVRAGGNDNSDFFVLTVVELPESK